MYLKLLAGRDWHKSFSFIAITIAVITVCFESDEKCVWCDRHQQEPVNDPVVINAMMFLSKTVHDSVK